MLEHDFWRHTSGEVYAVQTKGSVVIGICGPLHHSELKRVTLVTANYDDTPEDVEWVNEHVSEFQVWEAQR